MIKKPVRAAGRKWEDVRSELEDWIRGATMELDRLFIRPLAGAVAIPQAFSHSWSFLAPAAPAQMVIWRAPAACRAVQFCACYEEDGGSTAEVSASRNDDYLLAVPFAFVEDGWMATTDLLNTDFAAGDSLSVEITALTGVPVRVVIQVDFLSL